MSLMSVSSVAGVSVDPRHWIGGRRVPSGVTVTDVSPIDEQPIARVARGGAAEVSAAVQAASDAFPGWAATPRDQRARLLHAEGGKVVAVGDVTGAVRNPGGLEVPALYAHVAAHKTLLGFGGGEAFPAELIVKSPEQRRQAQTMRRQRIGGHTDSRAQQER